MTYPNQKEVQVAERAPRDGRHLYSMNNLDALRQAMNCLKGSGLKMWLYLNKNQDNYRFELSRKACEEWGIKKDSYYDGIRNLIDHGYLRPIRAGSNIHIFFENRLAENPNSVELDFYYSENSKPATEFPKTGYGIPKGAAENPKRNNTYSTTILHNNTSSDYRKADVERWKRELGF